LGIKKRMPMALLNGKMLSAALLTMCYTMPTKHPMAATSSVGTPAQAFPAIKTESNLGEQDYWVLKLSSTGTIEWQNSLRTNKNDMCTSLHPTSDAGYIVGGFSSGGVNGDKNHR
jgi:hypothetical protein